MRRDVFQAIADPTRREIITLLAGEPKNLSSVAENFRISRPAISKHIRILSECGLVVVHRAGRERLCQAKLENLDEVSRWVDQYRKFWSRKLDALENFLSASSTPQKRPKRRSKHTPFKKQTKRT